MNLKFRMVLTKTDDCWTFTLLNIITWKTDVQIKDDENDILLYQYINKCSEESRELSNQFNPTLYGLGGGPP